MSYPLGTQLILPDGRAATVVYNSLIGVGCKLGLHDPDLADFEGSDGNLFQDGAPNDWPWDSDVLLRDPLPSFKHLGIECVGEEWRCRVTRHGLAGMEATA